jgi:hypothetical protein
MIDFQKEELVTLNSASRLLPRDGNKRIHLSTLWRWCRKGLNGQHLEYIRVGRRIFTSREALGRFTSALAAADNSAATPTVSEIRGVAANGPVTRERAIQRALKALKEDGI